MLQFYIGSYSYLTILFICYTIVSLYRLSSLFYFTRLKESNVDDVMKNVNVQYEIEYCQNNEKIEDLSPPVCMSIRERNPAYCPVLYPGTR